MRKWTEQETADPDGAPSPNSIMAIFSPRKSLKVLEWYADQMDDATQMVNLTAAFGVNKKLAGVLSKDKDYLRFLLLEKLGKNYDVYAKDRDVQVSIGSRIEDDTRVADIYLGEFMRLFHHFYFRYIANKMKAQPGSEERKVAYLVENDSWTDKYYQDYSIKKKKRLLFA